MRIFRVILLFVVLSITNSCIAGGSEIASEEISINGLKDNKTPGDYYVVAKVIEINKCNSPCISSFPENKLPPFSMCVAMCTNTITVSEADNPHSRLIIFIQASRNLPENGKKYRFHVKLYFGKETEKQSGLPKVESYKWEEVI